MLYKHMMAIHCNWPVHNRYKLCVLRENLLTACTLIYLSSAIISGLQVLLAQSMDYSCCSCIRIVHQALWLYHKGATQMFATRIRYILHSFSSIT